MQSERDEALQEDATTFLKFVPGQKDSERENGKWNSSVESDDDHFSTDDQMEVRFETDVCLNTRSCHTPVTEISKQLVRNTGSEDNPSSRTRGETRPLTALLPLPGHAPGPNIFHVVRGQNWTQHWKCSLTEGQPAGCTISDIHQDAIGLLGHPTHCCLTFSRLLTNTPSSFSSVQLSSHCPKCVELYGVNNKVQNKKAHSALHSSFPYQAFLSELKLLVLSSWIFH